MHFWCAELQNVQRFVHEIPKCMWTIHFPKFQNINLKFVIRGITKCGIFSADIKIDYCASNFEMWTFNFVSEILKYSHCTHSIKFQKMLIFMCNIPDLCVTFFLCDIHFFLMQCHNMHLFV